jgi:hypothetical protein
MDRRFLEELSFTCLSSNGLESDLFALTLTFMDESGCLVVGAVQSSGQKKELKKMIQKPLTLKFN